MKKFLWIWVVALASSMMMHSPFSVAATKQFQSSNWIAECKTAATGKVRLCRMARAIRQGADGKPLLVTSVQRDLKNKDYMLVLRLPHGLNLPAGVQLQIDKKKPRRLAVLSSDKGGAFTRVNLSAKVLGTLKNGNVLKVSFVTLDGQRFDIPVSLSGFTATLSKLSKMR